VQVWHPADLTRGPFPLVLFSPGFGNKASQYRSQLEDLASHGYVVAGLDHAVDTLDSFEKRASLWAEDILRAKEDLLQSSLRQAIEVDKIGAFGHSLGGRAAAAACLLDSKILGCLNEDGGNDDVQLQRPYWPIPGRLFTGAFAMVDWFDPGVDDEDLRSMGKTRNEYAASRLEPPPAAVGAYRAAQRGAYRITILKPGMRHTMFTDGPWSTASLDSERARYAAYLNQVRSITLQFFEIALKRSLRSPVCGGAVKDTHTQCFAPATR
jgi:dienelactone hydrolase